MTPAAALAPAPESGRDEEERGAARSLMRGSGLLVLVGVLLLLVVLSAWIGTKDTSLGQVWSALWHDDGSYATDVVRELRLPRTLVGLMVGAALGVAGAVMQATTRNPLADPGLLGVNAGASAAVVFGIGVVGLSSFTSLVWFAFLGAAVATVLVYVLGASCRAGPTPVRLALAGAALQLVGLVRAALVDPAVLVLDEATADIDPDTAHRLETAIDTLRADRTLIVIAHRESTIKRLPRVVHLDEGSVLVRSS
ncbi:iron chelate uptake ABC transporter family permease subunit [Streptomyces sp. RK9]|uniref:iron chelate uptake ABC transporter family permease subunit n=1 Tax=Streptomyces sp. RK9 TaxID=3239284 RepID=UPI00386ED35E